MKEAGELLKDNNYLLRLRNKDYFEYIKELQRILKLEREREIKINK